MKKWDSASCGSIRRLDTARLMRDQSYFEPHIKPQFTQFLGHIFDRASRLRGAACRSRFNSSSNRGG
jgi:hypothetical protein